MGIAVPVPASLYCCAVVALVTLITAHTGGCDPPSSLCSCRPWSHLSQYTQRAPLTRCDLCVNLRHHLHLLATHAVRASTVSGSGSAGSRSVGNCAVDRCRRRRRSVGNGGYRQHSRRRRLLQVACGRGCVEVWKFECVKGTERPVLQRHSNKAMSPPPHPPYPSVTLVSPSRVYMHHPDVKSWATTHTSKKLRSRCAPLFSSKPQFSALPFPTHL